MATLPYDPETGQLDDSASHEVKFGLWLAGAFFIGLVGWAAFAPLDAAAVAPGQLNVAGQRQTVQHREGGIVEAIKVKEGEVVQQGQSLVELAGADVRAQERSLFAQWVRLEAQKARLEAEATGMAVIQRPARFDQLPQEDQAEASNALRLQAEQMKLRHAVLNAELDALTQQTHSSLESAEGFRKQMASKAEQEKLISDELESFRDAAEKGFISKSRIRQMERAKADLQGSYGEYKANAAQSAAGASATRFKQQETIRMFRQRAADELADVERTLADLDQRYGAAHDQRERLVIRAPVAGSVVGLSVFTPGGVIAPGQRVLDVVPAKAVLEVEARLALEDADDVKVGQKVQVRLVGIHEKNMPIMEGTLTRVSADKLVDEKTGIAFYSAAVSLPPDVLNKVSDNKLRSGSPVQVVMPVRARTALSYVFEPLLNASWLAFREK